MYSVWSTSPEYIDLKLLRKRHREDFCLSFFLFGVHAPREVYQVFFFRVSISREKPFPFMTKDQVRERASCSISLLVLCILRQNCGPSSEDHSSYSRVAFSFGFAISTYWAKLNSKVNQSAGNSKGRKIQS